METCTGLWPPTGTCLERGPRGLRSLYQFTSWIRAFSLVLEASLEANPEANMTLYYVILSPNITSKGWSAWPVVIESVAPWGQNRWCSGKVLPTSLWGCLLNSFYFSSYSWYQWDEQSPHRANLRIIFWGCPLQTPQMGQDSTLKLTPGHIIHYAEHLLLFPFLNCT